MPVMEPTLGEPWVQILALPHLCWLTLEPLLSRLMTGSNSTCLACPGAPKPLCRSGGVFSWRKKVWREGGALRYMEDSAPKPPPPTKLPGGFDAIIWKLMVRRLQEALQENFVN